MQLQFRIRHKKDAQLNIEWDAQVHFSGVRTATAALGMASTMETDQIGSPQHC